MAVTGCLLADVLGRLAVLVGFGLAVGDAHNQWDKATDTADKEAPEQVGTLAGVVQAACHGCQSGNKSGQRPYAHDYHQHEVDGGIG